MKSSGGQSGLAEIGQIAVLTREPDPDHAGVGKDAHNGLYRIAAFRLQCGFFFGG